MLLVALVVAFVTERMWLKNICLFIGIVWSVLFVIGSEEYVLVALLIISLQWLFIWLLAKLVRWIISKWKKK